MFSLYNNHYLSSLAITNVGNSIHEIQELVYNVTNETTEHPVRNPVFKFQTYKNNIKSELNQLISFSEREHFNNISGIRLSLDTFLSISQKIIYDYNSGLQSDFHRNRELEHHRTNIIAQLNKIKSYNDAQARIHFNNVMLRGKTKSYLIITGAIFLVVLFLIIGWIIINVFRNKELELKNEKRKVDQLFKYSTVPMYVCDFNGSIQLVNDLGIKALGYNKEEFLKLKITDLDGGYMSLSQSQSLWEQLLPGYQISLESQHVTKSGRIIDVELSFLLISDDNELEKQILISAKDITDKKRTQSIIRAEQERLNLALEGTKVAIWDWKIDSNEFFVDDKWIDLIGYSRPEFGRINYNTWMDHTHPDDVGLVNQNMDAHLRGETERYETRIRKLHKNGYWVWILDRGKITERDGNGKPVRVTGTLTDITEIVAYETALQESEQKYKFISESMPHILWILSPEGAMIFMNAEGYKTLGLELGPVTEQNWREKVHPDDVELAMKYFNSCLKGKKVFDYTYRILTKQSGYRWHKVLVKPELDKDGEVIQWYGFGIDMHELKSSEIQLQASDNKFRGLVDSFNDLIYTYNTDKYLIGAYGQMVRKVSLKPEDIIGKKPTEIMGDGLGAFVESKLEQVLITKSAVNFEWNTVGIQNPAEYLSSSVSPIMNDGEITELLMVTRFITQNKKNEIQLQNEKEKLGFLAEKSHIMTTLPSKYEVFNFVLDNIYHMLNHRGIVLVCEVGSNESTYTVIDYRGSRRELDEFESVYGSPEQYFHGSIPGSVKYFMQDYQFWMYSENDLEELGMIPPDDMTKAQKVIKDKLRIKSIGIKNNGVLIGKVTIAHDVDHTFDEDFAITFLRQSSAVLEKLIALDELRTSEQELHDSREKYRTLVDRAPVVLYEYQLDFGGTFYSKQAENLLGFGIHDLHMNPNLWSERIHKDDQSKIRKILKDFRKGIPFDIEYRIKHKDGNWRWFRDISINYSDNMSILQGLVLDITTEKTQGIQIQKQFNEIRRQELKLRVASSTAHQGIIEWKINDNSATWNEELTNILGIEYYHTDNFFRTLQEISTSRIDLTNIPFILEKIISLQGDSYTHVQQIKTAKGNKWIKAAGSFQKNDFEQSDVIIISVVDITDEKEFELALKDYNRQLKLLIENVPGVIFSCYYDDHYTMEFISDYIRHITEYSPSDFFGNRNITFADIIHPDDKRAVSRTIENAFLQKKRYTVSFRIFTRNNEIRWINTIGEFQSFDEPEHRNKIDGIFFDITENIKSEELKLNAILTSTDKERARLSREIHDNIQQKLVSAYLNFESIKKEIDQLSFQKQKRLVIGLNSLNEGLEDTRSLAHSLMPKQIEDFGLYESLENLISNTDPDINFEFYYKEKERYDPKIELNLYRIVQEAISNIIKHAEATDVFIQLIKISDTLSLTIEDDGNGFDSDELTLVSGGFGLHSMKSRAANIGARFDLSSTPGRGTYLIIEVPLIDNSYISTIQQQSSTV